MRDRWCGKDGPVVRRFARWACSRKPNWLAGGTDTGRTVRVRVSVPCRIVQKKNTVRRQQSWTTPEGSRLQTPRGDPPTTQAKSWTGDRTPPQLRARATPTRRITATRTWSSTVCCRKTRRRAASARTRTPPSRPLSWRSSWSDSARWRWAVVSRSRARRQETSRVRRRRRPRGRPRPLSPPRRRPAACRSSAATHDAARLSSRQTVPGRPTAAACRPTAGRSPPPRLSVSPTLGGTGRAEQQRPGGYLHGGEFTGSRLVCGHS